jgi:hypothetical protein
MGNNIKEIRKMLSFEDKDDFYFLQILKRRKDNPDLKRDMIVISNHYIESLEQYDRMIPHVISICDAENARAYFRVNKRNYTHLSYHMLKRVVEVISSGAVKSLKGSFDSVCGQHHSDKDKKWIVDIDWVDIKSPDNMEGKYRFDQIEYKVTQLQFETKKDPLMVRIPTKNGVHFITRPFNLKKFKDEFPGVDVHKDNPTLLYYPTEFTEVDLKEEKLNVIISDQTSSGNEKRERILNLYGLYNRKVENGLK